MLFTASEQRAMLVSWLKNGQTAGLRYDYVEFVPSGRWASHHGSHRMKIQLSLNVHLFQTEIAEIRIQSIHNKTYSIQPVF